MKKVKITNIRDQIIRMVSVIMVFVILIQMTGCYSKKIISGSDLISYPKYHYVIHYQKTSYSLENVIVSDGILSGYVNLLKNPNAGNQINIFPKSDSLIKIDSSMILKLNLEDILKIERKEISVVGIAGFGILILLIIGGISLNLKGFPNYF